MNCRHCGNELSTSFLDLGNAPPSNAYLSKSALALPETFYKLEVLVCDNCWLVQTADYAGREELFNDNYAYFSSYSSLWLSHAKSYVGQVIDQFGLSPESLVVEVACNDGYLLQYVKALGIPCYGIEPTKSTGDAAREKGIEVVSEFFGLELAKQLSVRGKPNLIVANNVLAHVPDINDFIQGFAALLAPDGVATFEFPHLYQLVENNQFDTVYHEHFSYLSFLFVDSLFKKFGLEVFDVECLSTHGGSLRVFTQLSSTGAHSITESVSLVRNSEQQAGLGQVGYYLRFQEKAEKVKSALIEFLAEAKNRHHSVAAYGAAAKGNTLLNFAGADKHDVAFVVDRNPAKQGLFMPGSHIPIVDEEVLKSTKPDYVILLPWNLREELVVQLSYVRSWGGKFVIAVPSLEIF